MRHVVDLSERERRLLRLTIHLPPDVPPGARIAMATWTPGSYVVRDHVRHLQRIDAVAADGSALALEPDGLTAWRLPAEPWVGGATLALEWHANEPGVRTTHVGDRRGLITGAATFPVVEPVRDRPHVVEFVGLDPDVPVHALLPGSGVGPYSADDHDHLADAAFAFGPARIAEASVAGVPHRLVRLADDDVDVDGLTAGLAAVAAEAIALFDGELPTRSHTMLALDGAPGGLEHRDGAVVAFRAADAADAEGRRRVLSLLAHEHLHLWNGRRLSPSGLLRAPLDRPHPTRSLWVTEGWTSYYDRLLPTRAGVAALEDLLTTLGRMHDHLDDTPGADRQSLHEASWNAWTKHYRRDENAPNAGTDYYLHGALVAFELDLALRERAPDGRGLDEVLALLWHRHVEGPGFTEDDVLDALDTVGGPTIAARCEARVAHPSRPEVADLAHAVGLVAAWHEEGGADLGAVIEDAGGGAGLVSVLRDRPAWRAGLAPGDVLVAVDGRALDTAALRRRLAAADADTVLTAMVRRGDRVLERAIALDAARPRLRLALDADATAPRIRARERWAGPAGTVSASSGR